MQGRGWWKEEGGGRKRVVGGRGWWEEGGSGKVLTARALNKLLKESA